MSLKVEVGQKYSKLQVVERLSPKDQVGSKNWRCKCDCGNERYLTSGHFLLSGRVKSCGCAPKQIFIPNIDQIYGDYLVLEQSSNDKNIWLCSCQKCSTSIELRTRTLQKNPSCLCKEEVVVENNSSLLSSLIKDYKDAAKNKGRDFALNLEDCKKLFFSNCHYCGSPPNQTKTPPPCKKKLKYSNSNATLTFNGVDRVDNSLGYRLDNVVSCCRKCNIMKAQLSKKDFIILVADIVCKFENKETIRSKIEPFEFPITKCGNLKVIAKSKAKEEYLVECICKKTLSVKLEDLMSSKQRSCGCSKDSGPTLPAGEGAFNTLYSRYEAGAKKRSLIFNLTKQEAKKLFQDRCFYCGILPSKETYLKANSTSFRYNGIDRLDNDKGYSTENCVTACHDCNHAKNNYSLEDFKDHVYKIFNFSKIKQLT